MHDNHYNILGYTPSGITQNSESNRASIDIENPAKRLEPDIV